MGRVRIKPPHDNSSFEDQGFPAEPSPGVPMMMTAAERILMSSWEVSVLDDVNYRPQISIRRYLSSFRDYGPGVREHLLIRDRLGY